MKKYFENMTVTVLKCFLNLQGKRTTLELKGIISRHFKTCATKKLLTARKVRYIPARSLMKGAPKKEPKYIQDKVDQSFNIIFFNKLYNYYVYGIPILFGISTVTLCIIGKILFVKAYDKKAVKKGGEKTLGRYTVGDPSHFALTGLVFICCVLLHVCFFARNQVLRMYYNRKTGEYAARLLRFGLYRKTIHFRQSEIEILPRTALSMLMAGNVRIQGRRVLCDEQNFMSIVDFNRFMSHDIGRASDFLQESMSEDINVLKEKFKVVNENKYRDFEEKYKQERKARLAKRISE